MLYALSSQGLRERTRVWHSKTDWFWHFSLLFCFLIAIESSNGNKQVWCYGQKQWEAVRDRCGSPGQMTMDKDIRACCLELVAANGKLCFRQASNSLILQPWFSAWQEFCDVELYFPSSWHSNQHEGAKLVSTANNILEGVNTTNERLLIGSATEGISGQQTEATLGSFVEGMTLVFGGWTLLSCLFWAPRLQLKRKDEEREVSSKTMLVVDSSISSGRSYASCSSAFSTVSSQGFLNETGEWVVTMEELSKATRNFSPSHKIGQGGFGAVYKGKLRNGTVVAIKRARKGAINERISAEFKTEIEMLSRIEHLNLVKLMGYLEEDGEHLLIFEYVPNGNLREHLDGHYGVLLDLGRRLNILIDVGHALTYLHLYADEPVIHRDVKSSNILLTGNFRAKVADFGFSKSGPSENGVTHVSTQVKGTAGYLDPEYLMSYQVTHKSDVYSFGVLMVEVFTGRRPIELRKQGEERVTIRWAFKKFKEGHIIQTVDPRLEITSESYITIGRMAELAFRCAAPTRNERPTMKEAVEILYNIRKDYQAWLLERKYKESRTASRSFQSDSDNGLRI